MKKQLLNGSVIRAMVTAVLALCVVSTASAQLSRFTGSWNNVDANTGGVTRLVISTGADGVQVHAWGKCHPSDCDMGAVRGYAYAGSVNDNMASSARTISAVYRPSFSEVIFVIHAAGSDQLRVETLTRFTDSSNRADYSSVETFARAAMQVKPLGPGLRPGVGLVEDCVSFNPQSTAVTEIGGRWKIVDGSHWVFDFGSNQAEARRSFAVIRHYQMNQSCFVGRPNPSFQYLLSGGQAPQGGMPGEDCVAFNPQTTTVTNVNGRWKVVDGSHWMFDFGSNQAEADQSLRIIRHYGFTRSCFVGRPDPSFQYLRR